MLREVYQGTNNQLKQIRSFVENEINKYIDMDIDALIPDSYLPYPTYGEVLFSLR